MECCVSRPKGGFVALLLITWLCITNPARAVVFDFSGPLDIIASTVAGGVSLSVYDPVNGLKVLNIPSGSSFDLKSVNGVATWSTSTRVYYYTYDPIRTNWFGENVNTGTTFDLRNSKGTVAWSSGSTVYCRVFDRQRAAWRGDSANLGAASTLTVSDSLVSWAVLGGVVLRTYDPRLGTWAGTAVPASGASGDLINTNGVAAWGSGNIIYSYTYDPSRVSWPGRSMLTGPNSGLRNQDGVVAWIGNTVVYFMAYDPVRGVWAQSEVASAYTPGVTITNSTVYWSTAALNYTRGYNPATSNWYAGPALPLASFVASTNNANPPLYVYFGDLSLAGNSWNWELGAGMGVSTKRSPSARYTGFNKFTVVQNVAGSVASASTNIAIVTDVVAPFGSLVINGGENFTTNPILNLTLSATDNSLIVEAMRFSNDATNWAGWEAFATSRVWTVATGIGTRTVFAQFRDLAGNVSTNASDSIELDTTPVPVLTLHSTNVSEAVGIAQVRLTLDHALTGRSVIAHIATLSGTATAGQDFSETSADVVFPEGTTEKFFSVPINNDPQVELNETIQFSLTSVSNATAGTLGTLTILDNDQPSVFFAAGNFAAPESSGNGPVTVALSQPSGVAISVRVQAAPGTATAGADFTATNLLVTFDPGQTNRTVNVPLKDDSEEEPHETVLLTLNNATNTIVGAPSTATLTITDDEPPKVFLSKDSFIVSEGIGTAGVNVQLSKTFGQSVFVDVLASGGTATAGVDYLPKTETIQFAPNQTNKTVLVTIFDNTNRGPLPERTVNLKLESVTGGTLGVRDLATLVMRDDDVPPRLTSPTFVTTNQFFHLTLVGAPGQVFNMEGSSALPGFTNLATLTNLTGSVEFTDTTLTNPPQRFYRTSLAP